VGGRDWVGWKIICDNIKYSFSNTKCTWVILEKLKFRLLVDDLHPWIIIICAVLQLNGLQIIVAGPVGGDVGSAVL
jgi:hypothetical protein